MRRRLKHREPIVVKAVHTSDARHFKRLWLDHGGTIAHLRRTGEARYGHPFFVDSVRANDRRKDVPAALISRLNQVLRQTGSPDDSTPKSH